MSITTPPPAAPPASSPRDYFKRWTNPPQVGTAIILMIVGMVFPPLALAGWLFARAELKAINSGKRGERGRGWIQLALVVSIITTCVGAIMVLGLLSAAGMA